MSEQAAVADSPIEDRVSSALFGDPITKQIPKPVNPVQQPVQEAQPEAPEEAQSEVSEDTPEQTESPQFEEVEYEGEKYQVPPKLKEAIIRHADYTKKTQEVSSRAKALEHKEQQIHAYGLQQEFNKVAEPLARELMEIDSQLKVYDQVNWREVPADERSLHMLEMSRLEKLKSAKEGEIESKRKEFDAKFQEQVRGLQDKAQKLLKERIPQWNETTAKETRDWAISNGFTEQEISSIHDPRHAEVLWKAYQFDKAKQAAQPAVAQAKSAKVGATNPMPQDVRNKLNFRKAIAKTENDPRARKQVVEDRIASIFGKR
jgi:hypothetical protein